MIKGNIVLQYYSLCCILLLLNLLYNIYINFTDNTEVIKGPEKVDDFLLSLFKALDRQKAKDDRKSVEKKVIIHTFLKF